MELTGAGGGKGGNIFFVGGSRVSGCMEDVFCFCFVFCPLKFDTYISLILWVPC